MTVAKAQLVARDWLVIIGLLIGAMTVLLTGGIAGYVNICERLAVLEANQKILIQRESWANAYPRGNDRAGSAIAARRRQSEVD